MPRYFLCAHTQKQPVASMENKEMPHGESNAPPRQATTLPTASNLRAASCHLKASLCRTVDRCDGQEKLWPWSRSNGRGLAPRPPLLSSSPSAGIHNWGGEAGISTVIRGEARGQKLTALQSQAASLPPSPAQPPLSLFGPCARQQRHACAAQTPQEEAREREEWGGGAGNLGAGSSISS